MQRTLTVKGIAHIKCHKHKKCYATRLYFENTKLPYLDVTSLIGVKVGDQIEILKTSKEIKIHQIRILEPHNTSTPDTRTAALKATTWGRYE